MVKIVGVRFRNAGKVYYFDPKNYKIKAGDHVIVETARGVEYGTVIGGVRNVAEETIVQPLKAVIRVATAEDDTRAQRNRIKEKDAMKICQEKITKHGLEMKLIDAEYTFDNNKVLFYFTADGRIDFRELVKDLAAVFRMRIELRQIGVRDEAKMLGGVGNCGRGLCCNTWLSDFEPVSIKMAKVQNLSLNPSKISGICGRLMCCLKFENEVYTHLKKGMPSTGERIKTPDGLAVVTDVNILENSIKTRLVLEEGTKGKGREKNKNGKEDKEKEQEEKLSTEFYYYKKEEIKRINKKDHRNKKREDDLGELDGELLQEIKELMKD